tara:strand:+ start:379 stop:537 length:159 start_codon:yes stop_codon:yes gene_type:complete
MRPAPGWTERRIEVRKKEEDAEDADDEKRETLGGILRDTYTGMPSEESWAKA